MPKPRSKNYIRIPTRKPIALRIGGWTIDFTGNRRGSTLVAVLDFFFPIEKRLRIEASSSVNSENSNKVYRCFYTFRALWVHSFYEVRQFFKRILSIKIYVFVSQYALAGPGIRLPLGYNFAIAFDAVSSAVSVGSVTSLSWAHTCTGSNLVLTVGYVSSNSGDLANHTGVTYNSVSMTQQAGLGTNGSTCSLWSLTGPAIGANTVALSHNLAQRIMGGAISFSGAHQTSPIGATTTGTGTSNPSTAITTSFDNSYVVDCFGSWYVTANAVASQTSKWNLAFDASSGSGGGSIASKPTAGSITFAWTYSPGANWNQSLMEIRQAPPTLPAVNINKNQAVRRAYDY